MEFKMKKKLLGSIIALTVSAVALPAMAGVGTITINGKLTQSTCTVNVNGGTPDAVITLPQLSTSELATAGTTAGETAFTMNLTNCDPAEGSVRAYFEHGPTVDATSGRLNNTNAAGAKNVQVELLDSKSNSLHVGNTSQRNNPATALVNGAADLVYTARYYATGASTAGELATSVTYSIDYE